MAITSELSSESELVVVHEKDKSYRLAPEWQRVEEEFMLTKEGRQVFDDTAFNEYRWLSSDEMTIIKEGVAEGSINPENISPEMARSMYYAHPSFISMRDRPEVLELIATGTLKGVELTRDSEYTTTLIRSRRLASILEELSVVTNGADSEEYENQAIRLNREVSESALYLPESPRKFHAGFSIYDMYFRRRRATLSESDSVEARAASHRDMASFLKETRHSDLNRESISGSFGEVLVELRLRDLIDESGLQRELGVSQSFIRQDVTHSVGLEKRPKWKWAFDLKLDNYVDDTELRVEVKKRTNGSRLTSEVKSYIPIINVVLLRLGRSKIDYLKIAEDYSVGRSNELLGEATTKEQRRAIDEFSECVDDRLQELIDKAKPVS